MNVTESRGYHLTAPASITVPVEAVQVVQHRVGKELHFTTEELAGLNARIASNLTAIYGLSDEVLGRLFAELRTHADALFATAEAVSLLDVLQSLAHVWRSVPDTMTLVKPSWVPPSDRGGVSAAPRICIEQGRNPVLEMRFRRPTVGNDVVLGGPASRIRIITGPNCSGKSTHLRTAALLTIMAHVGCPIPARSAELEPVEAVFARIGTDDDLLGHASSFLVEMRETASLLRAGLHRSLIVIDELGRSTCASDGAAVAWAVLEALVPSSAVCLFVTHMHELTALARLYPASVAVETTLMQGESAHHWQPTFRLGAPSGDLAATGYGIRLASRLGFPAELLQAAWAYRSELDSQQQQQPASLRLLEATEAIRSLAQEPGADARSEELLHHLAQACSASDDEAPPARPATKRPRDADRCDGSASVVDGRAPSVPPPRSGWVDGFV